MWLHSLFGDGVVLARHIDKDVREIIETQAINQSGESCISTLSINLIGKEEAAFLENSVSHIDQMWRYCAWCRKVFFRNPSVDFEEAVVYELPLSCGKYIGQTGRCLNDYLREHRLNVKNYCGRPTHVLDI